MSSSAGVGLLFRPADDHLAQKDMPRGSRGGGAHLREEVAGLRSRLRCKEDFCAQLIEENRQLLGNVQIQRQEHETEIDRVKREAAQVAQRLLDERLCLRAAIEELQEKVGAAAEALRTKQAQLLLAERRVGRGNEETKVLKRFTRSVQQQQVQTEEEARQLRAAYVELKKSIQTFASGLAASKFMVDGDCDYDALVRTLSDGIRKLESYNDKMVPSSEVEKVAKGRRLWQNKYDKLEKELLQGKETLEKVKAELDQRNRRVMQLRAELGKRKSLGDDIHHLMQKNRELQGTIEELQKERDALRRWKANHAIRPPHRAGAGASRGTSPVATGAGRSHTALASSTPQRPSGTAPSRSYAVARLVPRRPSAAATGDSTAPVDGASGAGAGGQEPRRVSRSSPVGTVSPVRRVGSTLPHPSTVFMSRSFITLSPPSASAAALAAEQKRRKSSRRSPTGVSHPLVSDSAAAVQAPAVLDSAAAVALPSAIAAAVASAGAAASSLSAATAGSPERRGLSPGRTLSLSPFASPSSVISPHEEGIHIGRRGGGTTLRSPRARAAIAYHTSPAPQYTSTAAIHASSPSSSSSSVAAAAGPSGTSPHETVTAATASASSSSSSAAAASAPASTADRAARPLVIAASSEGSATHVTSRTTVAAGSNFLSDVVSTPRQETATTFVQQTRTVVEQKRVREIVSGVAGETMASVALAAEGARVTTVSQYATVTPSVAATHRRPEDITAAPFSVAELSSSSPAGKTQSLSRADSAVSLSASRAPALITPLDDATGTTDAALPSVTGGPPHAALADIKRAPSPTPKAGPPAPSSSSVIRASLPAPAVASTTFFSTVPFPGTAAKERLSPDLPMNLKQGTRPESLVISLPYLSSAERGATSQGHASTSGSETAAAPPPEVVSHRSYITPSSGVALTPDSRAAATAAAAATQNSGAVAAADDDKDARASAIPTDPGERAVSPHGGGSRALYSGSPETAAGSFSKSLVITPEPRTSSLPLREAATSLSLAQAGGDAKGPAEDPAFGEVTAALARSVEVPTAAAKPPSFSGAGGGAAFLGPSIHKERSAGEFFGEGGGPRRLTESDDTKKIIGFPALHGEAPAKQRMSSRLLQTEAAPLREKRGSSASAVGASRTVAGPATTAVFQGVSHRSWGGEGSFDSLAAAHNSRKVGGAVADTRSLASARSCSTSSIAFFAQDEAKQPSAGGYEQEYGETGARGISKRDRKEKHHHHKSTTKYPASSHQHKVDGGTLAKLSSENVGAARYRTTTSSGRLLGSSHRDDNTADGEDAWYGTQGHTAEGETLPLRIPSSRRKDTEGVRAGGAKRSSSSSKDVTTSESKNGFSAGRTELEEKGKSFPPQTAADPGLSERYGGVSHTSLEAATPTGMTETGGSSATACKSPLCRDRAAQRAARTTEHEGKNDGAPDVESVGLNYAVKEKMCAAGARGADPTTGADSGPTAGAGADPTGGAGGGYSVGADASNAAAGGGSSPAAGGVPATSAAPGAGTSRTADGAVNAAAGAGRATSPGDLQKKNREGTALTSQVEKDEEKEYAKEKLYTHKAHQPSPSAAVQQLLRKVALKHAFYTGKATGRGYDDSPLAAVRETIRRKDQMRREDLPSDSTSFGGVALTQREGEERLHGEDKRMPQQLSQSPLPPYDTPAESLIARTAQTSLPHATTEQREEEKGEQLGRKTASIQGPDEAPATDAIRRVSDLRRLERTSERPRTEELLPAAATLSARPKLKAAESPAEILPPAHMERATATAGDGNVGAEVLSREEQLQQKLADSTLMQPEQQQQQETKKDEEEDEPDRRAAKQDAQQGSILRTRTLVPKARPLRMRSLHAQQHM